jgi:YD repeat-containing protein
VVGQNGQQDQTVTAESRTYDPAGHVLVLTTPGPNTAGATVATTYTYDAAGNVVTQAFDPTGLNRVTTNGYNLDGSVAWTTATGRRRRAGPRRSATPTTWPTGS